MSQAWRCGKAIVYEREDSWENMAALTGPTVDDVRNFLFLRGGRVTNQELVREYKNYLTNPVTQGESICILEPPCWPKIRLKLTGISA